MPEYDAVKENTLLFIQPFFPFPPRGGGMLRGYNMIKGLSQEGWNIDLVALSRRESDADEENLSEARQYCGSIELVRHGYGRWRGALKALATQTPYEFVIRSNQEMTERVERRLEEMQPSVVLLSRFPSMQYVSGYAGPGALVLDQHDLNRRLWESNIQGSEDLWLRWYSWMNRRLVVQTEERLYDKLDGFISVSREERTRTNEFAPDVEGRVVENGADTDYFKPAGSDPSADRQIVLLGSMDALRNVEAAQIFAREMLPDIAKEFGNVRFVIVGRDPAPEVRMLANESARIEVTGEVPDIRPFLSAATVVVAPYWTGSGVKHKIPISLAMEKAMVVTSNASHGLEIVNGEHALVADSRREFTNQVMRLLKSHELRVRLGRQGRSLVIERYSWEALTKRASNFLKEIAEQKKRRPE